MSDPYSSTSSSSNPSYDENREARNQSYVDPFEGIGNVDLSKLQPQQDNVEYLEGSTQKAGVFLRGFPTTLVYAIYQGQC